MKNFVGLIEKTYSHLIDYGSEDKKEKSTKFGNCKNCLKATQLDNKTNHLEKSKTDIDSFFCYKRKHKAFIKNNKWILQTQQRFKIERHNVFTEEVNRIALTSNNGKTMQSIDSIETYTYWTTKNI